MAASEHGRTLLSVLSMLFMTRWNLFSRLKSAGRKTWLKS
jgi:hypothetical protein